MADRRRQDDGQGDVKNPTTDGRLKENRGGFGASMGCDSERDRKSDGDRRSRRSSR